MVREIFVPLRGLLGNHGNFFEEGEYLLPVG